MLTKRKPLAIGIGASTGGPRALRAVLAPLPANYPLPILVVQHIGAESVSSLISWLNGELSLAVQLAVDGARLSSGVWIAPGDAHLRLDARLRVSLDPHACPCPHRPSVDVLLGSMARSLGRNAAGVVLSGMGVDGAEGVSAIVAAGGTVVAQDAASSVVFGMPRAAAEKGAQVVLPADKIANFLREWGPAGVEPR